MTNQNTDPERDDTYQTPLQYLESFSSEPEDQATVDEHTDHEHEIGGDNCM